MSTQQTDALAFAADVIAAAAQMRGLLVTLQALQLRQAERDFVTTLNNQPTSTVNADGSLGAADSAPNTAHPITTLGVTASDLGAFIGYGVNDVVSFLTGVGTPGYTDRRGAVGKILS